MVVKINETVPIKIKLPAKGVTLMLKPNCSGLPCLISVRNGSISAKINQSHIFYTEHDDGKFKPLYLPNTEKLHLNVSVFEHRNFSKKDQSTYRNFSLEVFATGCYYWGRLENSWQSDGCKVGQHVLHFTSIYCQL